MKMYFLLNMVDIPASYVSLPEGNPPSRGKNGVKFQVVFINLILICGLVSPHLDTFEAATKGSPNSTRGPSIGPIFGGDQALDGNVAEEIEWISLTLPETNIAPENGWLEYKPFLLGRPIFRGYVSFREGISCGIVWVGDHVLFPLFNPHNLF